ncbi:DNA polymerase zeta catalytic subunit-like [Phalaenopsis equestris]|uniref:DNA polymerase zeta catalytic subunit-like n=1 Tax=Phalaenopsis equestris TaxID=78828 RepID=UPI0009E38AD4|nr:DNA polymerase zeta catalytic subunit-like [Phalaenopsis equestris]
MVKRAMKKLKASKLVLHRILNARQLALKLISNVTYGYTAAGFSGRMPCAEIADSIVQCGRMTLETAISFVNQHEKWKAKVIYGDTDSMFVLLKGRSKEDAFIIGNEIASAITAMNPEPVTLKMEKVYCPCFLLTKKRYVGYSYESPEQEKPTFDAKGIETVRRDTCPAVAKTLERSIRLIFETNDLSEVESYLKRQWARILSGKVSIKDFVFAKEVRLGTYSSRSSSLPPAAIVAKKAMEMDPRAEPHYGERIPYVVIHGEPGSRLMDMVVNPFDLLDLNSSYRLNDLYYINKQMIPALQRVFSLLGADINQWFSAVSRPIRPMFSKRHAPMSNARLFRDGGSDNSMVSKKPNGKRIRIDTYYSSKHCILCGELIQSSEHFCVNCSRKEALVDATVVGRTSKKEREMQHLTEICRHCGGGDWIIESGVKCISLSCSVFYERKKVQKELHALSSFATASGFYPSCNAEFF